MLFIVQPENISHFWPADDLDARYGQLLWRAHVMGVEILVYQCKMN